MKKIIKLFLLVASSFLFIENAYADYNATVLNPAGAKCSLKSTSTGYCYYENANLNSYTDGVVWLDTGDEVKVITSKSAVASKDKTLCPGEYLYTSYHFPSKSTIYYGYYCSTYLTSGALTDELKQEFKTAGFPESYWEKLALLKKAHPSWNFKAVKTKLKFNDVVSNNNLAGKALINKSSSNNYALCAIDSTSFNYKNDAFIAYDGTTWYNANKEAIAYYIDPRNFLNDMYIFQFQSLRFDEKLLTKEQLKTTITSAISGTLISSYADTFVEAGYESKVEPIYLAALSRQEVGNSTTATSGTITQYPSIYNFYNIGATAGTNAALNGLKFASNTDPATLRPWNTPEKAIIGGAKWIYNQYVYVGQDTSYFKKWNVVANTLTNPTYSNYTHQYMTNILAPSSEANTTKNSYVSSKLFELGYTFAIPVYEDMPASTSLPTKSGWPNNYLKSIKLNGESITSFDGDVVTYNYNLKNTNTLKIEATPVSSTAKVLGTGTFTINSNATKTITVTAQNGDVKKYNINITLVKTEPEKNETIVEVLNNAGIKNGTYIYGMNVGTDIGTIKTKILNTNSKASVSLTNSSGKLKNSGIICTGDKVTITLDEEVKTYEIILYGDVNGDGKIAANDYLMIKDSIMGKLTLSGSKKEASDIDKNGKIAASDYLRIKDSIMGTYKITQ